MGQIDINTASKDVLVGELGLTEIVADRLIRIRKGSPILSEKDLTEVDGIGPATAARIGPVLRFPSASGATQAAGAQADNNEKEFPDPSGVASGGVEVGPDGKPKVTGKIDIGKLLDFLLEAFQWSSNTTDDDEEKENPYRQLADGWSRWDALDEAVAASGCPEEAKRRLRDLLHNIRGALRRFRNAVDAGNSSEAEDIAGDIKTWAKEAQKILDNC